MSLTFWCFKISPKQNPSYIWQVDSTGSRMLPIKQDKPLHLSARQATWWLCITLTQKPSFLSVIAFFFPLFAGRYSAWLKEFNFHLVIFSSRHKRLCDELGERRENLLNAEEGKGMHVLIVGVFAELTHDFEAFIYRHSSLLPGLCFDFDCHARHSLPRAHPHALAQRELRLWSGIRSWRDIGQTWYTRCMDFDWATLYLGAALPLMRPWAAVVLEFLLYWCS